MYHKYALVTPAKYESDMTQVNNAAIILKKLQAENEINVWCWQPPDNGSILAI